MFIGRVCSQIKESSHLLGANPRAISLIKGLEERKNDKLGLISEHIKLELNLTSISVLMV
jgi:glycerol-3-phosphate dehydrogenase